MRKRLLSTLLALCMALVLSQGIVLAVTPDSGTCGDNLTWTLDADGTLTISGTGAMTNYDLDYYYRTPWYKQSDAITAVVIGSGVTTIGGYAFDGCKSLTSVTIPDSVITIEEYAFRWCSGLTSVIIPNSVTSIGHGAFDECRSLESVTIPDSVTIIGGSAFFECASLTSVIIPNSVTSIGDGAFSGCFSLTNVTIPDSVTTIEEYAFYRCNSLTSINVPDGVTTIGQRVFSYCSALTSVTIPASVTSIEVSAFGQSNRLKDVYYGGSESQWNAISITTEGNSSLRKASIHYNSATPSTGTTPTPTPTPSGTSVTVGGKTVTWTDAEPFIDVNSRTMVPLRAVADAMSLEVNWDAAAREASFTDGTKTIIFPINSTIARTSDGGSVNMDTAAVISNDRTYAPIRYLAEFFGYTVGWDAATKTVSIT